MVQSCVDVHGADRYSSPHDGLVPPFQCSTVEGTTRMKRNSILLTIALVLLVAAFGAGGVLLVRYEPAYYRDAEPVAGETRKQRSAEFLNASSGLFNDVNEAAEIGNEDRSTWQWTFAAEQINSYFGEDF